MHLIFYEHGILDLRGLSTGLTVGVFVGSAYGCLRLAVDVLRLISRPLPPVEPPA
jgi:hypothetical protein